MTATANPDAAERTATITVVAGSETRTISVMQGAAAATLSVSPSPLSFAAAREDLTLTITTNEAAWTAESLATWLTLNVDEGTGTASITVTAAANPDAAQREAEITVSVDGLTRMVSVTQDPAGATLSVSPSSLVFVSEGATLGLTIESNASWTATSSDESWLTIDGPGTGTGNGSLSIVATANPAAAERMAMITIEAGTGADVQERVVSVTQAAAAATLSVSPSSLVFVSEGATLGLTIESNASWTAESSETSWLTIDGTGTGTGNGSLSIVAIANPAAAERMAMITVSVDGLTRTIDVTQAAASATLSVSSASLSFAAAGEALSLTITTNNASWMASDNASWLRLSERSGTGTMSITATAEENPDAAQREATITVEAEGLRLTVSVTQDPAAAMLSVSPSPLSFAAAREDLTLTITTNEASWTAESPATWLTLSESSGTGTTNITVTAAANPDAAERMAMITIEAGTGADVQERVVSVTQAAAAATLSVSPSSLVFVSEGATLGLTIESNASWTAMSNAGWLTLSEGAGTGTTDITATSEENPDAAQREATITVEAEGLTQTVSVTQNPAGATLSVSSPSLVFVSEGATLGLTIESNASWTAMSNAGWLTLSEGAGTGTTDITATSEENPDAAQREATITVEAEGLTQTVSVTQDPAGATLSVSSPSLVFVSEGATLGLTIESNASWTAVSSETSWLTIDGTGTGTGNGSLSIVATANPAAAERMAMITIEAGTGADVQERVVSVTQAAAAATLSVSPSSLVFVSEGATLGLTIESNASWTAVSSETSWLTIDGTGPGTGNGSLSIVATANPAAAERMAMITIEAGTGADVQERVVSVTQAAAAATLSVSPSSLVFVSEGATLGLTIESNASWTAMSNAGWLTLGEGAGTGTTDITATSEENPDAAQREATITVEAEGLTQTVSVTQDPAGATLSVSSPSLVFVSEGATLGLTIESNASWTAMSNAGWLTLSEGAGTGTTDITATSEENPDAAQREATITVEAEGLTQTVSVTQDPAGATLSVSSPSLVFVSEGATLGLTIESNASWTAMSNAGWLTLSEGAGTGTTDITATSEENPDAAQREATITVEAEGLTQTVSVTQNPAGATLSVSSPSLVFVSEGATLGLTIESNASWTAMSNAGWLTLSEGAGTGTTDITATSEENPDAAQREATITVEAGTGADVQERVVTVTQAGAGATVPGIPTGLTATAVSDTQIDLEWQAPANTSGADITGCRLEHSTDGGNTFVELHTTPDGTTFTYEHTGLSASTEYYYQVAAINSVGMGAYSSVVSATTNDILSVPGVESSVRVYPNPASQEVRLTNLPAAAHYRVYSLAGKVALTGTARGSASIDVSGLARGQYILVLREKDGRETLRARLLLLK